MAEKLVTEEKPGLNWNSLNAHLLVIQQEAKIRREREARAAETMRRVAERNAASAKKYGGPQVWQRIYAAPTDERQRLMEIITANPELPPDQAMMAAVTALRLEEEVEGKRQAALDDETDILINQANRRRQKARPEGRRHPIIRNEILPERRLERKLNPKPNKPARENRKQKIINSPAWQRALEWFRMTPEEQVAAEAEIANAVNTEVGYVAQALAAQAEWNDLEESGIAEQLDFSGFLWPT